MTAASAPRRHEEAHTPLALQLRRAADRDGNPLCRPVDRARSRLLVVVALTLVLSVVLGLLVALTVLSSMQVQAHRTALHRHQVTATTLTAASGNAALTTAAVQAAWDYPQGGHRTGVIQVAGGTASGARVPLWLDDDGNPAAAPPQGGQLETTAALYGLGAFAAAGTAVWTGRVVRGRMLDRRAERSWEPDWEQVEPLWSGRGH